MKVMRLVPYLRQKEQPMYKLFPILLLTLSVFFSVEAESVVTFEAAPCPVEYAYVETAECGFVTVPCTTINRTARRSASLSPF